MTVIQADFSKKDKERVSKEKKEPKKERVYQLHISLAFSDPVIWRRIEVPGSLTLLHLHQILQSSLGWSGEHNHQFYVGKIFYSSSLKKGEEKYFEGNIELQMIEEPMKWCFTYMYDAGDGWEHEIVVEEIRESTLAKEVPRLLDGEWSGPPEQVGSVHVYEEIVWALENPKEEKSKKLLEHYHVADFDPSAFDIDLINKQINRIGWSK